MLPSTLALVDDDPDHTQFLGQYLRDQGVQVDVFADSNDLLTLSTPYDYDFYVVDLMLPGVDGVDLIKLLRRRTEVGVVVVSGRLAPDVFEQVMTAGADMYLAKPVQFEQVLLAIKAVRRRIGSRGGLAQVWKLDRRARQLLAPDGARVDLSSADVAVMECMLEAGSEPVTREALQQRLGLEAEAGSTDGLNAIIFRLRRRIERATPEALPLQTKSRVGYVFKAPLEALL
jgi:DNA-binding response OmpR family regulator